MKKLCFICFSIIFLAMGLASQESEKASGHFQRGKQFLKEGNFQAALEFHEKAHRAEPSNAEYESQYLIVRQVVRIRAMVEKEKDLRKWLRMAFSLRAFYYFHEIYSEALALDLKIHEKQRNADSATMLAETRLTLGHNDEVVQLVHGFPEPSPQLRLFLAIALARLGRSEEAVEQTKKTPAPIDCEGLFYAACLDALLGKSQEALEKLARSFEATPPVLLSYAKNKARNCKDFSGLVSHANFEKTMKVESKIPESQCSEGSSCSTCPHRNSCKK